MNEHASAWKPLIDEWVTRESRLHPDSPIRPDSVRVRDAVEVEDQAFVLVSYDVDHPWPKEEDTAHDARSQNTAVLQALRVRQPWIERDAARALAQLQTEDASVVVFVHPLGKRRAFSGVVEGAFDSLTLSFDDGSTSDVSIVDGWFLTIAPESRRVVSVAGGANGNAFDAELRSNDVGGMLDAVQFARSAPQAMYFSPLDLRGVTQLVQWERASGVVVVAVALEQYDEGGILRLRVDGVRHDDDVFVNWPTVNLEIDGRPLASAICGEYSLADTITMDIGFKPWIPQGAERLRATVSALRGAEGPVEPIVLDLRVQL